MEESGQGTLEPAKGTIEPDPTPSCLVIVPVLGRAWALGPLSDSIGDTADVLFVCSDDDPEREAVNSATRATYHPALWIDGPRPGDFARKINTAVALDVEYDAYFLGATDLTFAPDWLEKATAHLAPGIGVVGTNDLGNPRVMRGEHATHSLITAAYARLGTVDGPGLLHEGYAHNWCDQEFVETARSRGAFAFAADSHVRHAHPHWGTAEMDDTYRRGLSTFHEDRATYQSRRHLWT